MARSIFGENSRDGYGYWGYVEVYKRMMLFPSREEYIEYISELSDIRRKEPYWKQQGSSFHNFYTPYNEGGTEQ